MFLCKTAMEGVKAKGFYGCRRRLAPATRARRSMAERGRPRRACRGVWRDRFEGGGGAGARKKSVSARFRRPFPPPTRKLTPAHPPPTQLLFLLATAAAAYAAARRLVAANTRSCDCCRGFGAVRCSLCRGAGTVAYEGKYVHAGDACPKCLGARCVACPECGGLFARRLFAHAREPRVGAAAASASASGDANDRRGWFGYGAQQTLLD